VTSQRKPLRVLIAPDKWKGNLSANDAADAIARGVTRAGHTPTRIPLADGGEGTLASLVAAAGGTRERLATQDALSRALEAEVATLPNGGVVVEAANCLGLALVYPELRPLEATSAGLGRLLLELLARRPKEVIIAIGGTATMDAGAGFLQALGAKLADAPADVRARDLDRVTSVDLSEARRALQHTRVRVACDVTTPLSSAALTFAAQKGANDGEARALQASMNRFAKLLSTLATDVPFGGAAGGLGAALHALGANLESGSDLVLDAAGFDVALARADFVVASEGCIDLTSLQGKVLSGVSKRAQAAGVPVVALAGSVRVTPQELWPHGISAAFAIQPGPCTEVESRERAALWLEQRAAAVCRLVSDTRATLQQRA
jgi:glycerate kinase